MKTFPRDPPYVDVSETWDNIITNRVVLDMIIDNM